MRCEIHCPRAASGVVPAVAVAVAAAVAAPVLAVLGSVALAVIGCEAAAGIVVIVAVWLRLRQPRTAPAPARPAARAAVTTGPRAIEAAPPPGITVRLDASHYQEVPR
jgi:protein-S-isoprenylcysteine O-methyltransferase Ste14